MKCTRRQLFERTALAAAAGIAGCGPRTGRLHLVFHGMMIFDFGQLAGEVVIYMPTVPAAQNDPGHVYCLTNPGRMAPADQVVLSGLSILTGAPAGQRQPDPNLDATLRRQTASDFVVNPGNCSCRMQVPWPYEIYRYLTATPSQGPGMIYSGSPYGLAITSLPLMYVFEYLDCADPRVTDDHGALLWRADRGGLVALNVHAEPPYGHGYMGHYKFLDGAFQTAITAVPDMATQTQPPTEDQAKQVGIPLNDFFGLPGRPDDKEGKGHGNERIFVADPGDCGSMFID